MRTIEIAPRTIVFTALFLLGLYFLWSITDLLFSLLIAFILMSALKPGVIALEKRHIPRPLAAVIIFLIFILVVGYLISIIIPPIVIELSALFRILPGVVQNVVDTNLVPGFQLDSFTQYVPNLTQRVFSIVGNVFSNIFFVITTLFFGFYFIIEEDVIKKFISHFTGGKKADEIVKVFEQAEQRMSAWFWGELTLMLVVGVFTFIGLNLIGMKYALALAVLAGLLEVVPNIGPIFSAIPAILIGFSISSVTGIAAAALYVIVQQLENTIIVPWIMRHAVGLDPIVTLIALLIGGKFGGVLGILLAIPIVLLLGTFFAEYKKNKKLFEDLI